jgi:hypothetical protein
MLRLIEIKTSNGSFIHEGFTMFKYGTIGAKQITMNSLNRAKLQAIAPAFALMTENPDFRFEGIEINWFPNESIAFDINTSKIDMTKEEIQSFLDMIREYYKNEQPDIYAKIKDIIPIWNASNYTHSVDSIDLKENTDSAGNKKYKSENDEFQKRLQNLKKNVLFESNINKYKSTALRKNTPDEVKRNFELLERDVNRLVEIMSNGGVNLQDGKYTQDFSDIRYYISTMSNTGNAVIDLFHQLFEQRSLRVKEAMTQDENKFYDVFMPFINQERASKGQSPLKHKDDIRKYLSKTSTFDVYTKLYKEYTDDEGNKRRGLFRSDEDFANPENQLTDIDKKLLTFLNNHYDSFFVGEEALLNKPYTYKLDYKKDEIALSALDVYNRNTYNSAMSERGN